MNCGACQQHNVELNHDCIEGRHLLHVTHWFFQDLEKSGHDLGFYTRRLHANLKVVDDYANAVANDTSSKERVKLHKLLSELIGAEHAKFKPFESDSIWDLPSPKQAKKILWNAILEHLWTYTTLYDKNGRDYKTVLGWQIKYFGLTKGLKDVFNES